MKGVKQNSISAGILVLFIGLILTLSAGRAAADEQKKSPVAYSSQFLTGSNAGEPLDIALNYLQSNYADSGLLQGDVTDLLVTDNYLSKHNSVTHVHTRQRVNGLEINGAVANVNIAQDGSVINSGNRYISNVASKVNATEPQLSAIEAVEAAAVALRLNVTEQLTIQESLRGAAQEVVISNGGISLEAIPAKLMYQPFEGELRLAWEMVIYELDAYHWWHMWVDAQTGETLYKYDWVTHDDFGIPNHPHTNEPTTNKNATATRSPLAAVEGTYNVYPIPVESPIHGDRSIVEDPYNVAGPTGIFASPFGWHDDDGVAGPEYTVTRGNNTHAYQDLGVPNTPDPFSDAQGGADLIFDFPYDESPSANFTVYKDAAVTNLFYWTNINHDVYYYYGFDEAAGNFQENNYGRGGVGGDYVFAEAQDGSGTDNANFATPTDGSNPRMQMYVWALQDIGNTIDGDFDSGIIAHEYGHGISIRLTGGGANVGCMNHAEREGEGWSDWLGLVLTTQPEHLSTTTRGIGAFALNQPPDGPGIRSFPYTTDMNVNPQTFSDTFNAAVPHGVGSIWATMLWDLYWAYVDKYGYDADVYNATGTAGNLRHIQLIFDGMKMQPCDPTFTEARDAILSAEQVLTGGENECMIWEVFARRGLGASADSGSRDSATDGSEAFDLPLQCIPDFRVEPTPQTVNSCAPADGVFDVAVNDTIIGYTGAVDLSIANLAAGLSATFSNTNIPSLPGNTTLTVSNTGSVASGRYNFDIVGDSGTATDVASVILNVADVAPTAVSLVSPEDGDVTDQRAPFFFWDDVALAAAYDLEISTTSDFSNIVYTASTVASQHKMSGFELSFDTTYFWRVRAINGCGNGAYSALSAFSTVGNICNTYDVTPLPPAPITGPAGAQSTVNVPLNGTVTDVNVTGIEGTHTNMTGVAFSMISPEGTFVTMLPKQGGCVEGFSISFDDQADIGELPCPPTDGGTYQPLQPLAAINGENSQGTWTLDIVDQFVNTAGTLDSWSLEVCVGDEADYSDSSGSYGRANHTGDGALKIGTGWDVDLSFGDDQDDDNDDGVTFDDALEAGQAFELAIDVTGTAANGVWLAVFADLNDDGDFTDADETLFNEAGSVGANTLNGTIPAGATFDGTVEYRVRLYDSASDPITSPTGAASSGEVQDGTQGNGVPTTVSMQSGTAADGSNVNVVIALAVILTIALFSLQIVRQRR